jgi:hypothetical protein
VAGLVLLTVVVAGLFVVRGSDGEVITPAAPRGGPSPSEVPRAAAAAELLDDLTDALSHGTRREVLALAAPGEPSARRALGAIHDNVEDLGITDLTMRFVDEDAAMLNPPERRELGPAAWAGDVALSWRIGRYDEGQSRMEVPFVFVDTAAGAAFGAAGADRDDPAPLWLLTDLAVERSRRALVAVADGRHLNRYAALADGAVRDVRAVLPRWRGGLVVEVPASQAQLGQVLDAPPDAYESIAAVTATVDGSRSPSSPVHILVNPGVFAGLGQEGAQIVMSHEATHVAVDAATSTMPLWLLEGFADYVALAGSPLPVSVTASQILAEVRREGPPRGLPRARDFDPSNKLLGTSYEAAWLACRLLAEEYGEARLVELYRAVDAGTPTAAAFADLGTTEPQFTARWRQYLRELAG